MTTPDSPASRHHPDEQELARAAHASDALRQLLAAAAAPPSKAELKGRARAVAAFRAAARLRRPGQASVVATVDQPDTDAPPRTESPPGAPATEDGRALAARRRRARLARARRWSAAQLTVAGAALLMLLGATAAAAAAGQLPAPLRQTVSDLFVGPDRVHPGEPAVPLTSAPVRPLPPSATRPASAPPAPTRATPRPPVPRSSSAPSGRATDPASRLAGLCRAYLARGSGAAMLAEPGFLPLVPAAGGRSEVEGYCVTSTGFGHAAPPPGEQSRPEPADAPGRRPSRSHHPAGAPPAGGSAPTHPGPHSGLPAAASQSGKPHR